jgi:adenosylhomocysteine nucleosidase
MTLDVGALVTVPQAKELAPLLGALNAPGARSRPVILGRLECYFVEELGLVLAVGGHGKAQHAATTQHLIDQLPALRAVICAGAAGALAGDLTLGDIVVGTSTIEHDYKLRFVARPLPRHGADPRLLSEFRAAADRLGREFRVVFGGIASGDEDIVDAERGAGLREATGALCVAWEGAGAARAARLSGLPFLEVRTITDRADHAAVTDFEANLNRSMPNLARLIVKWATE